MPKGSFVDITPYALTGQEIRDINRDVPSNKIFDRRGAHKIVEREMRISVQGQMAYPSALPGHKVGIENKHAPNPMFSIVYQMVRSRNILVSFRRMVEMSLDANDVAQIVENFKVYREVNPSDAEYKDLVKAFTDFYDIGYRIEETDYGTLVRMWDERGPRAKEEWNFVMRRGEHRIFDSYDVDFSKVFNVDEDDFLSMQKYYREGGKSIKKVRLDLQREGGGAG